MEETTDQTFYRKVVDKGMERQPPFAPSTECAICTRPLYGPEHEDWHVNRHIKQFGLISS